MDARVGRGGVARALARLAGGCYRVRVFGIGTFEMLVVAVLALLLFSPRELPKIIKGISSLWGSLRRTADEFRDAVMQEEAMQDLKDAVDGTKAQLRDAEGAARRELMKARMEARRAENKLLRVARERERQEREAAAKEAAEAGEDGGGGEGKPAGDGPGPSGTVATGSSATSNAPNETVDPRRAAGGSTPPPATKPAPRSEPPPKTVDPRHAGEPDGSGGGSSASQGAA
jgi:Sec-independent protein translocase protein TatA